MVTHDDLLADVDRVEGHLSAARRAIRDGKLFEAFEAVDETRELVESLGFRVLAAKSAETPVTILAEDIELQDLIADFCSGEQGTEDLG